MDAALVYYGGMLLLFFFWVYGIASFALDVKNTLVPTVRGYVRARREEEADAESEAENRREELY